MPAVAVGSPEKLARFRAALAELKAKKRTDPVRVLWLGDSHTAADFWPDAVRHALQAEYGNGGPGFLYAGLRVYRHASVKFVRDGAWREEPKHPSLWMPQDDGVFGLGGIRAVPDTAQSSLAITLGDGAVEGRAHWDVAFRLPTKSARFQIATGEETRTVDARVAAAGSIAHTAFTTPPSATVTLGHASSDPQFLGVTVESETPGVVVDSLGVNGARIGTPLAWQENQWVEEARLRKPSLVVLAYGTNEAGDADAPWRYGKQYDAMLARIREAAPDTDCLVIGPTDREDADWVTLPRVPEIDAVERSSAERLGCAFFSAFEAMGGPGGDHQWANQNPALAAPDHVHLTPKGYVELGKRTLAAIAP